MLRVGHRRAPERHDRVADVLVQGAAVALPDRQAHGGQVFVDVDGKVFRRETLRDRRKPAHVREQHREFLRARRHVELLGVFRHLFHQFRRHVLAEQAGDEARATRFDEETVSHVERIQQQYHHRTRGDRQNQVAVLEHHHVADQHRRQHQQGHQGQPERVEEREHQRQNQAGSQQ
ncbi:hypothetical protein D3C83_00050 [compost metagenome]